MRVVYYQRRPGPGHFSIESFFETVRSAMPADVKAEVVESRWPSQGLFRRLYNTAEAVARQGDINHITGDIHYAALGLKKSRTILTIHDCGSMKRLEGASRDLYRIFWLKLPVMRSSRVTAVSEFSKREIESYLPELKLDVRVVHAPLHAAFTFSEKGSPAEKPKILFMGTSENKNLLRVIEALRNFPCKLTIVGVLSSGQKATLHAAKLDYENFVGPDIAHVASLYKSCDLVLFPSTFEGFGLPIIEANAVGRPIIAGNVTSMPEIAADAALLVDPYQVEAIRNAVERVCTDATLRKGLVERGLHNVKRFSPAKIAGQYYSLYREMLA